MSKRPHYFSGQKTENEALAAKINAYWKRQGITANARVEGKRLVFWYRYDSWKMRVRLVKPDVVVSYEIASDLGHMAAVGFGLIDPNPQEAA